MYVYIYMHREREMREKERGREAHDHGYDTCERGWHHRIWDLCEWFFQGDQDASKGSPASSTISTPWRQAVPVEGRNAGWLMDSKHRSNFTEFAIQFDLVCMCASKLWFVLGFSTLCPNSIFLPGFEKCNCSKPPWLTSEVANSPAAMQLGRAG